MRGATILKVLVCSRSSFTLDFKIDNHTHTYLTTFKILIHCFMFLASSAKINLNKSSCSISQQLQLTSDMSRWENESQSSQLVAAPDPDYLEAALTVIGSNYKSHLRMHKESSRQNRPVSAPQCRAQRSVNID